MKYTEEHDLWMTNDKLFFDQLQVGRAGEVKVASRLMLNGIPVQLPPLEVRDKVEDRFEFRDQADLYAGPWAKPYRIEVKHLNYEFEDKNTFPWQNVIVVTTNKWSNILASGSELPIAFVMASQKGNGMFCVPVENTKPYWKKRVVRDRVRNMDVEVFQVDIAHCVDIEALIKWLRSKCEDMH